MPDANPRWAAVEVLTSVLGDGRSLTAALGSLGEDHPRRALVQEMCYGTLRHYHSLAFIADSLVTKPLKRKDTDLRALILLGLYQLLYMRIPPHAAQSETVAVAPRLGKPWAKALINAVLRNFARNKEALLTAIAQDDEAATDHPGWFVRQVREDWPESADAIIAAGNAHPPMTLRVNRQRRRREEYLELLLAEGLSASACAFAQEGVTLTQAVPAPQLPGFADGVVSIQDEASQLAVPLLDLEAGDRVLDACAAPGGKSCHILETRSDLAGLTAVDVDAERVEALEANLHRLRLSATTITASVSDDDWWDGHQFDKILLDAPCSATGIIRRHPDIKLLRRGNDIDRLAGEQKELLYSLWTTLKAGGTLLYTTCSVLPQENDCVIAAALDSLAGAVSRPIEAPWGVRTRWGRQLLPTIAGPDGFYYALLAKHG